jgi:hypothetical protein
MKYTKERKTTTFILIIITMISVTFQTSCKKEPAKQVQTTNKTKLSIARIGNRIAKTNPYEIDNIKNSLIALGRNEQLQQNRIYYYYKFNPEKINGDVLSKLEQDSTHKIMDIPFADGSLYSEDNSALTENEIANYKDGSLYIVFNSTSKIKSIFENGASIEAEKISELYLPKPEDEDLQIQALISSGYSSESNVASFKLHWPCLLKRPRGKVTYLDQFNNNVVGVPQIQVWALVFGIQVTTNTDDYGNYSIPWLFSAGTFMGTHAKNWRANVKPLNTTGSVLASIAQVTSNFIIGSVHWQGWYGSCAMKNDINIHFGSHNQARYWAQLLHALKLHVDYTAQDGITHAPNLLTIYAQWGQNTGDASAPMLGHIQTNPISLFANFVGILFNTNLSVTAPNLYNLFTGLLPDVTFKESSTQGTYFSEALMETAFHEFGHASLYQQVGQTYWIGVITNILAANGSNCGGYGCGNETFAGLTQVNESWAEFIGKEYHKRIHPTGRNFVRLTNGIVGWYTCPKAQEDVPWFANNWINTGIFYDLMDPINEPNDNLQGYSIKNMYNYFTPATDGFCFWKSTFIQNNPSVNQTDLDNLMKIRNEWSGKCKGDWIDPIFNKPQK